MAASHGVCLWVNFASGRNIKSFQYQMAPRAGFEPATNRLTAIANIVSLGYIPVRPITIPLDNACIIPLLAYPGITFGNAQ